MKLLYSKLAFVVSAIAVLVITVVYQLSMWSNDQYHKELTQKLHSNLAQYVIEHLMAPLFLAQNGDEVKTESSILDADGQPLKINRKVLKGLAMNTMMINPNVEVYLIDVEGNILGHALPETSVDGGQVAIEPVKRWLSGDSKEAVFGDNPRDPERKNIFSVAPVFHEQELKGYLYIVLASLEASSLANSIENSHVARVIVGSSIAMLAFFLFCAVLVYKLVSQPLKSLASRIRNYRKETLQDEQSSIKGEVAELEYAFELMQERIQTQFDQIAQNDRLRRELVSNISHDLRTPLASMQGYLETMILKADKLSAETQQEYIAIAHRHSKQLSAMVAQLFELSKLEAGRVDPVYETFSLTELVYDLQQDFALKAEHRGNVIEVNAPEKNVLVNADISLIQRVLVNLVDNAISHSYEGDPITLILEEHDERVAIKVKDCGKGISEQDLPYVFERFYQAHTSGIDAKKGAGLGLSIVKKILELHGSLIRVHSMEEAGTEFCFELSAVA